MLAYLIRQARPKWSVRSAGTVCSHAGAEVPNSWRVCIPEWTERHSARRVTTEDIDWADVVVGVQPNHRKYVEQRRPDKPVVLYRFVDPCFQPVATWPEYARVMKKALPEVLERIEMAYQTAQGTAQGVLRGSD